jgi:DNA-binding transcriptional LysR family regulator
MHEMNLYAVDLNLLVVLDALLATRSTTEAGKRLALSQPATSHALARLRDHFQDPLLVRAGRSLVPTPLGESLAPRVAHALAAAGEALKLPAAFDPRRSQRTFQIGAGDYAASALAPQLSRQLSRAAPSADLFIKPHQELAHLDAGEVELVLRPPLSTPSSWLRTEELFRDRFVCILRRDHPLARRKLTLDAYCQLGHVLVAPAGNSRRGAVDDALEARGKQRRVAVAVPHFLVAPLVVMKTDYVITLAERVAKTLRPDLGLAIVEPPLELPGFEIVMHWHARHEADAGHGFLREVVRRSARGMR